MASTRSTRRTAQQHGKSPLAGKSSMRDVPPELRIDGTDALRGGDLSNTAATTGKVVKDRNGGWYEITDDGEWATTEDKQPKRSSRKRPVSHDVEPAYPAKKRKHVHDEAPTSRPVTRKRPAPVDGLPDPAPPAKKQRTSNTTTSDTRFLKDTLS